jgi:hypothetical protein
MAEAIGELTHSSARFDDGSFLSGASGMGVVRQKRIAAKMF